jgi:phospholipid/cholesterol/gamma-HCH transport system permease protein
MFTRFGIGILSFFSSLGEFTEFFFHVLKQLIFGKNLFSKALDHFITLGLKSIPMVSVTAIFVGMAFAVQIVNEFLKFGAGDMIGGIVGLAVWRELSPLLTGVVFSGRVGAAISAELGSMKVTEQIDALRVLGQDPVDYLIVPRVLACILMLPLLVGLADILGFLSGFLVSTLTANINPYGYFSSAQTMLDVNDIVGGLIKAVIFGGLIAIISCYLGLKTKSGAKGVGTQTTKAVVISLVSVFVINYFLSVLLYSG